MNGLEGNDVMSGNSGNDIADGEKDDNTISGGDNSLDQITGGPYKVVIYGGGGDEHIAHNEFAINLDDIIKPDGSRDKIDFTADFVAFQTFGVSVSFVEPIFDISSFFY